ncbi:MULTISPECIES: MarR family winged helix-turn-helix transcriptional regulator [unclassified Streptomyces]|uniref:MarR family winged helix-turn-helix transcriptional regulator n=1 Tax=unclassified Streptomyces TaxID=2593676 RepID=UPI0013BE9203|nr:MarR family winged helix-turn-helix transcriptional regulator [Streptomyces sp. CB09001]
MSTVEGSPSGAVPPEVLRPGFQAWLSLVHTYGSVAKVLDRRLTRDLEMSLAWFEVLTLLLTAADGRRRMLELSQLLVVSKASVSKLVDRMERAGLVRRETTEQDRRAVYAVITPSGEEAIRKALPLQIANVDECFSGLLDEQDMDDLVRILGKVISHYEGVGPSTPSTPSSALLNAEAPAADRPVPAGSPADGADVERKGRPAPHPLRKRQ